MITATESAAVTPEQAEESQWSGPSKSQKKRDVEALQDLGTELVKLPEAQFRRIDLPEDLRAAVAECRRITQNSALRRQRQYIGKLMRSIDPEPIRAQLEAFRGASARENARLHQAERWRERLIGDNEALTRFLDEHPGSDATQLRQLIRNARDEVARSKPPKAFRELFRLIREAMESKQAE